MPFTIITCPVCSTRYEESYEQCSNCNFKTIHHQAYMMENSKEPQRLFNDTYGIFTLKSFIFLVIFIITVGRLIMAYYNIRLESLIFF